jgi:CRISPR-associated endoribonuclease Cas6
MRISIEFFAPKEVFLPWDYLDWLGGLFYRAMERGIPKLARDVHDRGFIGGGKRYKLVTFSLLYPEQYEKTGQGLRVHNRLRWWVASPLESFIEAVALGLLTCPEVRLGPHTLHVGQIGVVLPPTFSETMELATLSPILVSTGERGASGAFHKRFLSPQEPDFVRVLVDNLKRKSEAMHGEAVEGNLQFEWLNKPKSKLMKVKDVRVRGWMMTFRISGPVELVRIGYDAGFGERNAQGFGMVCTAEEYPTAGRE